MTVTNANGGGEKAGRDFQTNADRDSETSNATATSAASSTAWATNSAPGSATTRAERRRRDGAATTIGNRAASRERETSALRCPAIRDERLVRPAIRPQLSSDRRRLCARRPRHAVGARSLSAEPLRRIAAAVELRRFSLSGDGAAGRSTTSTATMTNIAARTQSQFENDFGSWRERRMSKRQLLSGIREHMEVVGSDDQHVGTVDRVAGDRIILTKSDPEAGGAHHSLMCTDVDRVEGDQVFLDLHRRTGETALARRKPQPRLVRARGPGPSGPAHPRSKLLRHLPVSASPAPAEGVERGPVASAAGPFLYRRAGLCASTQSGRNDNGARLAPDEPPAGTCRPTRISR